MTYQMLELELVASGSPMTPQATLSTGPEKK
jgi:hypothetical protein